MNLGIFAKTYERTSVDKVFAAAAADHVPLVQFNFVSAGLPPMPDAIDPEVVDRIRNAADKRGVTIVSISATFNMIHPDVAIRERGLQRLDVMAEVAADLGATVLSLCTGTRDLENMWRHHPGSDLPDAWSDIVTEMKRAVAIAEKYDLHLGIEPEPGNVIRDAERAVRLLEEIDSDRIGIVLDPANLIEGTDPDRINETIDAGIAQLGTRTIMAHGKDRNASGQVQPPGHGIVPWDRFLTGLQGADFAGPLILHGLAESDVPTSVAFLKGVLSGIPSAL
jgi:sugar phosphate isomerase/epimerase